MPTPRMIVYIGNFRPEHSTESHVARAFEAVGHRVLRFQEDDDVPWIVSLWPGRVKALDVDMVLWTRTWKLPQYPQIALLDELRDLGVPTVGYHLDRWWGLQREADIARDPWFACDLVVTADGGHDKAWADAGVNHRWLPPAVLGAECEPGERRGWFACDVAFVGSWLHYHREWPWRRQLVEGLRGRYRRRFGVWPRGNRAIRGRDLADLYASAKVVVGDSCLTDGAGGYLPRYWSDRVPETLGRGGCLVHPDVDGLAAAFTLDAPARVPPCDLPALFTTVDALLDDDDRRARIAENGRAVTLTRHTYEHRAAQLLELVGL